MSHQRTKCTRSTITSNRALMEIQEASLLYRLSMMATIWADRGVHHISEPSLEYYQKDSPRRMFSWEIITCSSLNWTFNKRGMTTHTEVRARETLLWCCQVSSSTLLINLKLIENSTRQKLLQALLITRSRESLVRKILLKLASKLAHNTLLEGLRLTEHQVLTQQREVGAKQAGKEVIQTTITS